MKLSREAKLVSGVILLVVPTIMCGGITLLGILTEGVAGIVPGALSLNETQWSLWRAGHAHAGVWVILSLVMQVLIDSTRLSTSMMWVARISAPVAAVALSGGFFGLAFFPEFQWLLYFGGLSLIVALVLTGVGLLRNLPTPEINT
ncbi:MAG: hypothetical protein BroJett011_46670 [Chloroflexota bacterium]|nr:MAG: hypothetical protein BroJett011_46670 [Chloroflexota bacterium]